MYYKCLFNHWNDAYQDSKGIPCRRCVRFVPHRYHMFTRIYEIQRESSEVIRIHVCSVLLTFCRRVASMLKLMTTTRIEETFLWECLKIMEWMKCFLNTTIIMTYLTYFNIQPHNNVLPVTKRLSFKYFLNQFFNKY